MMFASMGEPPWLLELLRPRPPAWQTTEPVAVAWECPVCHKGNGPLALKCQHCADKLDLTPRSATEPQP